jgi:hypothetical protein
MWRKHDKNTIYWYGEVLVETSLAKKRIFPRKSRNIQKIVESLKTAWAAGSKQFFAGIIPVR